jgi:hypothetical protein
MQWNYYIGLAGMIAIGWQGLMALAINQYIAIVKRTAIIMLVYVGIAKYGK